MQPLKPGDPAAVGGHRLLARLGAGGMGVVYLARSEGGGLLALKVIRAEYAADPRFRARFRREAAAARTGGRWLLPVTAADPDGRTPWLATAFAPGPSLAEAVDTYGPLPERTVRILGARLAEALTEVHGAGLVHRDLKPGNVLLALDGPRLIDFGIARADGATALTATDLVIGTPGFLSPEQAQARGAEVGPPSDVFSLGALLAYAATGRRPFAAATIAGTLFRTVHEPPDLDGTPPALLPLLRSCLAKEPMARPTGGEVRGWLEADPVSPGCPAPSDDWLPAPLPGLIAERSAAVLALPDPDPVPAPETGPEADTLAAEARGPEAAAGPAARGWRPSRRLLLGLAPVAAVGAAGGGFLFSRRGDAGGGRGPLPRYTLGLQADLSGPSRVLGLAQERGARLAVAHFNDTADRPFDLALSVRDDRGEPGRAAEVAARFVADERICGLLGPTGDAGLEAVVGHCQRALLPLVSVSVDSTRFNATTARAYVQLRPSESALSSGFLRYLSAVERSERTALIDDRAATGEEKWSLLEEIRQLLPAAGGLRTSTHQVPADTQDFGPVADSVLASRAQAAVYVGSSPHRAARCARALDLAGFDGTRMAPEQVLRPALPADGGPARLPFPREAGAAAEGWVCVTAYTDPLRLPAAGDFLRAYRATFPTPPAPGPTAPFALEAYDALLLLAAALRRPADGGPERGSTTTRLRTTRHTGLAKTLRFDARTGQFDWERSVFLWRVERGAAVFLGQMDGVERRGGWVSAARCGAVQCSGVQGAE
ncbi:bifunctional serine/threonine-protein kinase/ABC transporter substrate-binding protein [Streptomyces physcomitrii]